MRYASSFARKIPAKIDNTDAKLRRAALSFRAPPEVTDQVKKLGGVLSANVGARVLTRRPKNCG